MNEIAATIQIIRLLEAATSVAISAGINVERFNAMRASNASGHLSDEQLLQLAEQAHESYKRM